MGTRELLGPPDLVCEVAPLETWFLTGPRVVVTRVTDSTPINDAIADWIAEHQMTEIRKRIPEGRFTAVQDWLLSDGYTSSARVTLTQWAVGHRKEIEGMWIVMPKQSVLLRMGVSTARLALLAAGVKFEMDDDMERALRGSGALS